jgi:hypothetical protein
VGEQVLTRVVFGHERALADLGLAREADAADSS